MARGFGAPAAFGQTTNANPGTSIAKYQETIVIELMKNGRTCNVNIKHITAMKKYEAKSLEELRMEDYLANRKGPQQSVRLFGQAPAASGGCFESAAPQQTNLLEPKTTRFAFPTQSSSLFGQATTSTAPARAFGGFGTTAPSGGGMFGATPSAFSQNNNANPGTSIARYQEMMGTDTLMENGQANNVITKQNCITAMKKYEAKSLEELRMEDYLANRKGPQQGVGLFGQASAASGGLFVSTSPQQAILPEPKTTGFAFPTQSSSVFSQATTSNAPKPAFRGFGKTAPSGGGMFGATPSAFGQTNNTNPGTSIARYQGIMGTDTLMENGQANDVITKQHCITAMKKYEAKSLEELRMEDYLANRKGPQQGVGLFGQAPAASGELFGSAAPQQTTTGLFGQQPENKGLFGAAPLGQTPGFGQNAMHGATSQPSTGLFTKPFSAPTHTRFSFGGADANKTFGSNPVGQTQSAGLFRRPATTSAFGQTTTGFGTFATANTQQPSLFGTTAATSAPAFGGLNTPNLAFSGLGTNTSTAGGGLFGNKQAAGFGATPAFSAATSTAKSGFETANQESLFKTSMKKTATPAFGGFGTYTSTAQLGKSFNFGSGSLVNNNANKPDGLVETTRQTGSLLGGNTSLGQTNTFSGFGGSSLLGKVPSVDETDALKPTNAAAQKAILESTSNGFKVSPETTNDVKVNGNDLTKKSLSDGLKEYDSNVAQCFNFKPNAKRLGRKPKTRNTLSRFSTTPNSTNISNAYTTPTAQSTRPESVSGIPSCTRNATPDAEKFNNEIPSSLPQTEVDGGRRESWLHPLALDRVKEQNKLSRESIMNNTLSELVSRKTDTPPVDGKGGTLAEGSATPNKSRMGTTYLSQTSNDSLISSQSILDDNSADAASLMDMEPHPTGIVLRRKGYYTIPSLDDLNSYLAEDGTCVVPNFTIGRHGYGKVFFNEPIDVAGINLDEIVHFRHKEVIIYPDDENKPPLGSGLNRKAQITLYQDSDRLAAMDYEGQLRRICDKHDTRLIGYRPKTGNKSLFDGLEEYDSSAEQCFNFVQNVNRLFFQPKTRNTLNTFNIQYNTYATPQAQSTRPESVSASCSGTPNVTPDAGKFNNEIRPSLPQTEVDGGRRESWLHPLALDRVMEQNKLSSESVMNNTLPELVSRKTDTPPVDEIGGISADGSATPNKSRMGTAYVSQTSNDSLIFSQSVLDDNSSNAASGSRSGTPKATPGAEKFNNETSLPQKEVDGGRRESWRHPPPLDRVQEQNKLPNESIMNNTHSELVSRKTDTPPVDGKGGVAANGIATPNNSQLGTTYVSQTSNDSLIFSQSFLDDNSADASLINMEPHPTGIILHRKGYYTIPSLDDLNSYLAEDGTCVVPNFTIGRHGYGNVFFNEPIDVAGINLDEIVHFRHKEAIIYPNDNNKPPLGSGLNREAQITLDQVWPHDKTLHEPIKDADRLAAMDYEGKLRRICDKYETRFIEYRPETGSWVFKVDHFSKYGVSDSDEEGSARTDHKKGENGSEDRSKAKEGRRWTG